MNYKIKITYDTGNSFNKVPNEIGYVKDSEKSFVLTWENRDIVKANLHRIHEHYLFADSKSRYVWNKSEKEKLDKLAKEAPTKDWYIKGDYNGLNLQKDDGSFVHVFDFWNGYFETLKKIEAVQDNSDLEIEVNY